MLSLNYEYQVIPAPRRAAKSKSAGSIEDRFALALSQKMNEMGREGWEYVRTDTLPMDERAGLTGTKTSYVNMLVFRRVILHTARLIEPANEDFEITKAIFDPPNKVDAPKKLASFAKSSLKAIFPAQGGEKGQAPDTPPSAARPKAAQVLPRTDHLAAQ
jgi:hypothetical protein